MDKNKEIHFYADIHSIESNNIPMLKCYYDYVSTSEQIEKRVTIIHTTSMANFNFDLLEYGYKIFLHKNKKMVEIKPSMSEIDKELRVGYNILKLFLGHVFDHIFE